MNDAVRTILMFAPTGLFLLFIILGTVIGLIRGFRKGVILAIQALVAFIAAIIFFAVIANNPNTDRNIVSIANNFMGQNGLQKAFGVEEYGCETMREILVVFIPKQINYGDGLYSVFRDNGQYLGTMVNVLYQMILAVIAAIIYLILVFILYIIYAIFYPERRHKAKVEERNSSLDSDKSYKKRTLLGGLIGLTRGLISGIIVLAFFGSFLYMIAGTGERDYSNSEEIGSSEYDDYYSLYKSLGSYGTSGIYKVLNTIKNTDNVPFYLYACDMVFSTKLIDENRGINENINLSYEMGAYTNFARDTFDLLMKTGGSEIRQAIISKDSDKIMDSIVNTFAKEEFQTEFDSIIDKFEAKTYFVNFTLAFLDSFINYIDTTKAKDDLPEDAYELICLLFKKNYLSDYIPEEKLLKDSGSTNYEAKAYIRPSDLLVKDDIKHIFKMVVSIMQTTNKKDIDEKEKMVEISNNVIPEIEKLSILSDDRKEEFNPILKRLYTYADNKYIYEAMRKDGITDYTNMDSMGDLFNDDVSIDYIYELKQLLNVGPNAVEFYSMIYGSSDVLVSLADGLYNDPSNLDYEKNIGNVESIKDALSNSKLLSKVLSSKGIKYLIEKGLKESMPEIYIPVNIKFENENDKHGETYNFLNGLIETLKNKETNRLISQITNLNKLSDNERIKFLKDLSTALSNKEEGASTSDYISNSILLRSILSGAVLSNTTIDESNNLKIIVPNSIKEEIGGEYVNLLKKEEFVSLLTQISVLLPDDINDMNELMSNVLENRGAILESDVLLATVVNYLVNGNVDSLSDFMIIDDKLKAEATEEKLIELSNDNVWRKEARLMTDALYELIGESDVDFNDPVAVDDALSGIVGSLNLSSITDPSKTKVDVCFESEVIAVSLTERLIKINNLTVPEDALVGMDYKLNNVNKKALEKIEVANLINVIDLMKLDVKEADLTNIYLNYDDVATISKSKIFRATIQNELEKSNDSIIIPSTALKNGYLSETSAREFLELVSKEENKSKIFEINPNGTVNIKKIKLSTKNITINMAENLLVSDILTATIIYNFAKSDMDEMVIPTDYKLQATKEVLQTNFENCIWMTNQEIDNFMNATKIILDGETAISEIKEDSIKTIIANLEESDIDEIYKSTILMASITKALDDSLKNNVDTKILDDSKDYYDLIPNIDNKEEYKFYTKAEINSLVTSMNVLDLDIDDIDASIDNVKQKVLGLNEKYDDTNQTKLDKLYESNVVVHILANELDKVLTESIIKTSIRDNQTYIKSSKVESFYYYKETEVEGMINSLNILGVTDIDKVSQVEYEKVILNLSEEDVNKLYQSVLIRYILAKNIDDNITSETLKTSIRDSKLIKEELITNELYYKESEISSLINAAKALNIDDISKLKNEETIKDIILNLNSKISETSNKTKLNVIYESYLAKYIIAEKTDKYLTEDLVETPFVNSSRIKVFENELPMYGYYKEHELSYMIYSLNELGVTDISQMDTYDYSAQILNLNDAATKTPTTQSKLHVLYESYIIRRIIAKKLDKNLTTELDVASGTNYVIYSGVRDSSLVKEEILHVNSYIIHAYEYEEVANTINSLKALGVTNISNINPDVVKNKALNLNDNELSLLYQSILTKYILAKNLDENIITDTTNPNYLVSSDVRESSLVKTSHDEIATYKYYKQTEVKYLLNSLKEFGVTDIANAGSYDYTSKVLTLTNNALTEEGSTKLDVMYKSYIIKHVLANKLDENVITDASNPNYLVSSEVRDSNLVKVTDTGITDNYYVKDEVLYLLNSLKEFGVTDIANAGSYDYTSKVLTLTDNALTEEGSTKLDVMYKSYIIKHVLANKLDENIITDTSNPNYLVSSEVRDSNLVKTTDTGITENYYVKNEVLYLLKSLKEFGVTDLSSAGNYNYTSKVMTLNTQSNNESGMTKLDVMYNSYIIKYVLADKLDNNLTADIINQNAKDSNAIKDTTSGISIKYYKKSEVKNLINSLDELNVTDISAINGETIKSEILNLNQAAKTDSSLTKLDVLYLSYIIEASLADRIENSIDLRLSVKNYAKEYIYDLTYNVYKKAEVRLLIIAAKEGLGLNSIDEMATADYAALIKTCDSQKLYNSILAWDVFNSEFSDVISSNADIKDHEKAKEERITSTLFYKKAELDSLKSIMVESNIATLEGFDIESLVLNDTTIGAIDNSYIIQASISGYFCDDDTDSLVIPKDCYDYQDNLIKQADLNSLLYAIKDGVGGNLSSISDELNPNDIQDINSLVSSIIMRANISEYVKQEGKSYLYIDASSEFISTTNKYEQDVDYDSSLKNIAILSEKEIKAIVEALKAYGATSFEITISIANLVQLDINKLNTMLESDMLLNIISELILNNSITIGSYSFGYNTSISTSPTITVNTTVPFVYNLVADGLTYKFKAATIKEVLNVNDININGIVTIKDDYEAITKEDILAYVTYLKGFMA